MQTIPLSAVPSQTVQATLAGQPCSINVITTTCGLFVDLYVNGILVIGGVIAENANRIVRSAYLGFQGDLAFYDTQAGPTVPAQDPVYTGFGATPQFILVYLTTADLAGFGLAA
jgi:hypothetical protein